MHTSHTLAVVPIVMSAGAAVLPTVMAAAGSVLAILFKPRELLGLCRRRPLAASVTLTSLLLLIVMSLWLVGRHKTAMAARGNETRIDWARVAEDLLAQEAAGKVPTIPGAAGITPLPATAGTGETAADVTGQNLVEFSRANYDGGISPERLTRLWRFGPEETMFLSKPVVRDGRIYVAGCQSDLGGYTGLLACVNGETGKPIWQVTELAGEVFKPFFSSPALTADGKYLIIGQGLHEDHDCSLLCFDTATGKLHWAVKTTLHIESSPAIRGDMAVVGAGAIEGKDGRPTGDPGFVLAVRVSDGKELWRVPVNDPESSPVIDEAGIVYIGSGFNGNAVVALRSEPDDVLKAKNLERVLWKRPVSQPVVGEVTLAGDVVIVGAGNGDFVHSDRNAQGFVVALDRKTGEVRWQRDIGDSVLGAVACRDGVAIVPSRTGEVFALAVRDGSVIWRKRISGNAPLLAGCAFSGTRVYGVSSDGLLAVLDAKDGTVLEKLALNDQGKPGSGLTGCPPQVVGGHLIVGSETGGVQCLAGRAGGGGAP